METGDVFDLCSISLRTFSTFILHTWPALLEGRLSGVEGGRSFLGVSSPPVALILLSAKAGVV